MTVIARSPCDEAIQGPRAVAPGLLAALAMTVELTQQLLGIALSSPERAVSHAPVYQMLWLRGFGDHTILGRGFNLFKPLRRHFRAGADGATREANGALP